MEGFDRWQIDERNPIQPDIDQTFFISRPDPGQTLVMHDGARGGAEDAALAGTGLAQ